MRKMNSISIGRLKKSSLSFQMNVVKRNGTIAPVEFNKIVNRLAWAREHPFPLEHVNIQLLARDVIQGLVDQIQTSRIDEHAINLAASRGVEHYDYLSLAARLTIDNHHKMTYSSFRDKTVLFYTYTDKTGRCSPIVDKKYYMFVEKYQKQIDLHIDYSRDYLFDFFGIKVLMSSYLLKVDGKPVERINDYIMRVAIFTFLGTKYKPKILLKKIFDTYDALSQKLWTYASPVIFNAGLRRPGCISCFLVDTDDSIEGIYNTLATCAKISASCGGVAFSASKIRSNGARIAGTNGISHGIVPFLKVFAGTALAVNQSSRRNGSFAIYLDMHHPDIEDFLLLKRSGGIEELRCRELFYGLWIPDLYMKRLEADALWSLFDPVECPGLNEVYGEEYEALYEQYEERKLYRKQLPARDLLRLIYESHMESGTPYLLFKDTINRTSNQKNIGLIRTSNLCAEIVEHCEYLDERPDEADFACCTLASIALPEFVEDAASDNEEPPHTYRLRPREPRFNFKRLEEVARMIVCNLNHIIDATYYPTASTERGNKLHRPLGIGIQGLANVFFKFNIPFDSPRARDLNRRIAETIYYATISQSTLLCREIYKGYMEQISESKSKTVQVNKKTYTAETLPKTIGSYATMTKGEGSPLWKDGQFNFQLHGLEESELLQGYDWQSLRQHIQTYGMRNSLLTAYMPTASTSHILGNSECFEPYTSNIFTKTVLSGNYLIVNKYLIHDLVQMGLWNDQMKGILQQNTGSVQNVVNLPAEFRQVYRTAWEIPQKAIVEMTADRQPFVCQSQSMNIHMAELTPSKHASLISYAFKKGLKTGLYYLRTRPATMPEKFNLDIQGPAEYKMGDDQSAVEYAEEGCIVCSG